MKLLLLLLVLLQTFLFGSITRLIEDDQFNLPQYYTRSRAYNDVVKICKAYPKNKFTPYHCRLISETSIRYKEHPVLILGKIEAEQSLIRECANLGKESWDFRMAKCMGYGLDRYKILPNGTKKYKYKGFETQVIHGAYTLRYWYDKWNPSTEIEIELRWGKKVKIVPENAATYALYQYTPMYGSFNNEGYLNTGLIIYPLIWDKLNRHIIQIDLEFNTKDLTINTK